MHFLHVHICKFQTSAPKNVFEMEMCLTEQLYGWFFPLYKMAVTK